MVVVVVEVDAATEVMEEVSQSASPGPASAPTNNYWGWKETVKGTLSNLDLSKLGKAKQETVVSPETLDTNSDAVPKVTKGGGYWEWTETIKKTLSTVSLGTMGHEHVVEPKNNVASLTVDGTDGEAVKQSQKNYWHWRNSFKSASNLAQQEKDGGSAAGASAKAPTTTGLYWFWRNPSMTSLSQVNLDQAGKEVEGDCAVASTPTKTGGPITNLEHRMRNSWRKSFQKLSNSSLTKLDEGGKEESKSSAWKESFRSFRESVQNLNGKQQHNDSIVQEVAFAAENDVRHDNNQMPLTKNDSQQSLGGITF